MYTTEAEIASNVPIGAHPGTRNCLYWIWCSDISTNGNFYRVYATWTYKTVGPPPIPIEQTLHYAIWKRSGCSGCDCYINLSPLKTNIIHGQKTEISINGCSSDTEWTVTSKDGVMFNYTQTSNSVIIKATSGEGDINVTAHSSENLDCKDTAIIKVGCNSCNSCSTTKL